MHTDLDLLILSLDTATEMRSVALCRGRRQLAGHVCVDERENSATLLRDVDAVLAFAGATVADVDLFAVACGPGRFTGLRAGIATVQALAATLGRPAAGVPTLHGVAHVAGPAPLVVAVLPAGRGEVFAQLLEVTGTGVVVEHGVPVHLSPSELMRRALSWDAPLRWAISGRARSMFERLEEFADRAGILWIDETRTGAERTAAVAPAWSLAAPVEALAVAIAELALRRYQTGESLNVKHVRALYVRLSDAEITEQCRASSM